MQRMPAEEFAGKDPHLALIGEWKPVFSDGRCSAADDLRITDLGAYVHGLFDDVIRTCDRLRENPAAHYAQALELLHESGALRQSLRQRSALVRARRPGSADTELLMLGERQARMVDAFLAHNDVALDAQRALHDLVTGFDRSLQEDVVLQSYVMEESHLNVPTARPLFLIGRGAAAAFSYTVVREDGRLRPLLRSEPTSIEKLSARMNGALYEVTRVPRPVQQNLRKLRSVLLSQYVGIKRQIYAEQLRHYPLRLDRCA